MRGAAVPSSRVSLFLMLLAFTLGLVTSNTARARVQIEMVLESGPTAPLALSASNVRLDDGVLAIEYLTHGPEAALVIGLFGGGTPKLRAVDNQTNPPDFTAPCFNLELGGLSEGRIFFTCVSIDEGASGMWVWEADVWAPLLTVAGGVPGCSGPMRFGGFSNDGADFRGGQALLVAGTVEAPNNCFGYFLGGPSGVASVGHAGLPYPSEFGSPFSPGWGAAMGAEGLAFQWSFAGEGPVLDHGIFVDRGQGLETWAGTVPSMPQFDELAAAFAPDTGEAIQGIQGWDAAGGAVAFTTSSYPNALYVWQDAKISLIARQGMPLLSDPAPISWLEELEVSEEFVFFSAKFEDGSRRLFARGSEGLIEIKRYLPDPESGISHGFDLYARGADGRQVVYETVLDNGNRGIFLATVGVEGVTPPITGLAGSRDGFARSVGEHGARPEEDRKRLKWSTPHPPKAPST